MEHEPDLSVTGSTEVVIVLNNRELATFLAVSTCNKYFANSMSNEAMEASSFFTLCFHVEGQES